jgi:hypothetical protein
VAAIPTLLGSAGYWIRAIRSRVIQAVSVLVSFATIQPGS